MNGLLQAIFDAQEPWRKDAACREHPEVEFYPNRGESNEPAKALCAVCLVREECLRFGLRDPVGIWGGTTRRERQRLISGGRT